MIFVENDTIFSEHLVTLNNTYWENAVFVWIYIFEWHRILYRSRKKENKTAGELRKKKLFMETNRDISDALCWVYVIEVHSKNKMKCLHGMEECQPHFANLCSPPN